MNTLRDRAVQAHTEHRERLEAIRRDAQRRDRERAYAMLQALVDEEDAIIEPPDETDSGELVVCGVPLFVEEFKLWARRPRPYSSMEILTLADLGEVIMEWEAHRDTVESESSGQLLTQPQQAVSR